MLCLIASLLIMLPVNDIGVLHLQNGGIAIIDADRFEELSKFQWRLSPFGYVTRTKKNEPRHVFLHRQVTGMAAGVQVDHWNGFKIDNRERNLRAANSSQNTANSKKQSGTSSVYKGVSWDRERGKWHAMIKVQYRAINLGRFDAEIDAAKAYNAAALQHFGEFARLNAIS